MNATIEEESGKILSVEGFAVGDYVGHCATIGGKVTSHSHRIESFRQVDPCKKIFKASISRMPGLVTIDSLVREPMNEDDSWIRKPVKVGSSVSAAIIENFLSQPYERSFEIAVGVFRKLDKKIGIAMVDRILERMKGEV